MQARPRLAYVIQAGSGEIVSHGGSHGRFGVVLLGFDRERGRGVVVLSNARAGDENLAWGICSPPTVRRGRDASTSRWMPARWRVSLADMGSCPDRS